MLNLIIKEEIFGNRKITNLPITLPSEKITLAELIQKKVATKVCLINNEIDSKDFGSRFKSLKEQVLNKEAHQKQIADNEQRKADAKIDPEKAGYEALDAFQKNAFFVIIDGKQREDLKEELHLSKHSEVQFIRLMPLVGG